MIRSSFSSRTSERRLGPAAAVAVVALSLLGCTNAAPSGPAPSTSQSQSSAATIGHYKLVDNLCDHVDLAAISAVLPHVEEALNEDTSPMDNAMICVGTLGISADADDQGLFLIYAEVFETDGEAEDWFNRFYDVNKNMSSASDVNGIGQKAYQLVLPVVDAPTVKVLDGNAVISCEWNPSSTDHGPAPDGILEALTETIRGTMTSLRSA